MTVLLAILLALGVPFAQLSTSSERITCCCPSPDHCTCPDHKPDKSGQPSMRTCHKQSQHLVRAQLAAFVAPPVARIVVPVTPALHVEHVLPSPHAPPALRRPDAPS